MDITATLLSSRKVIALSGADATNLLQATTTNELGLLSSQPIIYNLLLNPQGRYLADFFVVKGSGYSFLIDVDAANASALLGRLKMYQLRQQVSWDETPNMYVVVGGGAPPVIEGAIIVTDPRLPELGWRAYVPAGNPMLAEVNNNEEDYIYLRYQLAVVEGIKELEVGKAFPLEYHLDKLNAISFDKGCYIGQELTTRTKFRGTVRKQPMTIYSQEKLKLSHGDTICVRNDNKIHEIGEIITLQDNYGVVLVRVENYDAISSTHHNALELYPSGQLITITSSEWYKL